VYPLHHTICRLNEPKSAKTKTYNSGYSLVVTHLTTNPPVRCLNRAERTGSLVFNVLWSYVKDGYHNSIYILFTSDWKVRECGEKPKLAWLCGSACAAPPVNSLQVLTKSQDCIIALRLLFCPWARRSALLVSFSTLAKTQTEFYLMS
jgi:hypothetical protein